jgi:hypothetical protein
MTTNIRPSDLILQEAFNFAIKEDKPILFDYWEDSHKKRKDGGCFIGIKVDNDNKDGEKLLVKSKDEYTSPIGKIPLLKNIPNEYLIITENSIYIVSSSIDKLKIKGGS